jgi:hypothetical protein
MSELWLAWRSAGSLELGGLQAGVLKPRRWIVAGADLEQISSDYAQWTIILTKNGR